MNRRVHRLPHCMQACCLTLALALSTAWGQDQRPTPLTPEMALSVAQCRISLINKVTLASPRAGLLASVNVRESHRVRAKQVVAELDSSVTQASLGVAREKAASTVAQRLAKQAIELTQIEYDLALKVNRKVEGNGVFGDIDLLRLKLNVDKFTLQFEQSQNESQLQQLSLRQIEAELKTYLVEAPFDGIVTRVHRAKGESVSLGDPLLEIVNLDRVRVEGYVSVVDGLRIKQGTAVSVQLDLPDVELPEERLEFPGKLVFVDVGVEPVSGQIRVWAEVPNPDGILRAGLPARMKVQAPTVAAK